MRPERNALLTDFGKKTLENQYLQSKESYQELFARVSGAFADDQEHAQRLYDYMSQLWFMPATPVLANGGTDRGLPISCFLNESPDSLSGIIKLWTENAFLSSKGGGIGSYWGNIRSMGEALGSGDRTSGIVPFIKVMESISLAINQGSLRRGAAAAYLPISHPEIEEFIDIRKPTGGDYNRKALYLHHGVVIPHNFMEAVERDLPWSLVSPHTGHTIRTVSARSLWIRLLTARMETGEPYILFIDHVNAHIPEHHKKKGLWVKTSNLCTEIMLPTGKDYLGNERTAVCCLSSVNVEHFLQWESHPHFVSDIFRFLDNVLDSFIENAPPYLAQAVYSAKQERSVGLGVMGFHAFCQSRGVPLESAVASSWNRRIFSHLNKESCVISRKLALEKGPCPDASACGVMERFSNKIAIAPNASTSIICGGTSPGIEPVSSNAYIHKTLSGSFLVRNRFLEKLLDSKGINTPEVWSSIIHNEGSVSHLHQLTEYEKSTYKTAFEINQKVLIDLASVRQPYICQGQSVNLFLPSDIHKKELHEIHLYAWKRGLKSLYYARSKSIQRPENESRAAGVKGGIIQRENQLPLAYEECLSCQ